MSIKSKNVKRLLNVMARKNKRGTLTKGQAKGVRAITKSVLRKEMEVKTTGSVAENLQLLHNRGYYQGNLLYSVQGTADANNLQSSQVRVGDQINLRQLNVRLWLSNKNDRPNVMYKAFLFWYDPAMTLSDANLFFTQTNKMLDRINTEKVGIIDQKTVFSRESYSVGVSSVAGSAKEHSYLCTLNGSWKGKKITYNGDNSFVPRDKDIGLCVVCYDAFGTLQTDNIASFAFNYVMRFQDP